MRNAHKKRSSHTTSECLEIQKQLNMLKEYLSRRKNPEEKLEAVHRHNKEIQRSINEELDRFKQEYLAFSKQLMYAADEAVEHIRNKENDLQKELEKVKETHLAAIEPELKQFVSFCKKVKKAKLAHRESNCEEVSGNHLQFSIDRIRLEMQPIFDKINDFCRQLKMVHQLDFLMIGESSRDQPAGTDSHRLESLNQFNYKHENDQREAVPNNSNRDINMDTQKPTKDQYFSSPNSADSLRKQYNDLLFSHPANFKERSKRHNEDEKQREQQQEQQREQQREQQQEQQREQEQEQKQENNRKFQEEFRSGSNILQNDQLQLQSPESKTVEMSKDPSEEHIFKMIEEFEHKKSGQKKSGREKEKGKNQEKATPILKNSRKDIWVDKYQLRSGHRNSVDSVSFPCNELSKDRTYISHEISTLAKIKTETDTLKSNSEFIQKRPNKITEKDPIKYPSNRKAINGLRNLKSVRSEQNITMKQSYLSNRSLNRERNFMETLRQQKQMFDSSRNYMF